MKLGLGLGINLQNRLYNFQPETKTLLAALTGTYSTPRKREMDKLIKSLKTAGIWSKLDVLQMYAAPTAADAVVNWKNPGTFNATLVNSPTLEVDRGITGNGSSSYINSGFTPSNAVNMSLNSAMFGFYIQNSIKTMVFGVRTNTNYSSRFYPINIADKIIGQLNDLTDSPEATGVTTGAGFTAFNRSATNKTIYKNGASVADTSSPPTATGVPTANFLVGAFDDKGSIGNYNALKYVTLLAGSSLTLGEHSSLFTALETYLDYIGAGVVS